MYFIERREAMNSKFLFFANIINRFLTESSGYAIKRVHTSTDEECPKECVKELRYITDYME